MSKGTKRTNEEEAMSLEREKVFSNLKQNIQNVLEQIEKAVPSDLCSSNSYSAFLMGLEKSGTLLAQSINNTALMYRSEPSPTEDESDGLCKSIESKSVEVLNSFLAVPRNCGKYFLAEARAASISTLKSCISFVEDLIKLTQSVRKKKRKKLVLEEKTLTSAAEVWEKGHQSIKELPKNNYVACSKFILIQLRLISDAISELDEARKLVSSEEVKSDIDELEMDEFELNWSEADLRVLGPATGLLKTVKNLVKKIGQTAKEIGANCNDADDSLLQDKNNDLDRLCDICAKASPASDDLAATLYPPIEPLEVNNAASCLITISNELLHDGLLLSVLQLPVKFTGANALNVRDQCEKGSNGNVSNWAEFLEKALKHNEDQLNLRLAERGLNILDVEDKHD